MPRPSSALPLRDAVLLRRARHGAGVERHADRAGAGDDPLGGGGDGGEVGAGLGQRAGDLVDEERAGDAAGLRRVGQGDVVVDDDHADVEAEGAGALGGEAEVQPVAGVVLDDEEAPGRAGDGEDAGEDGVDRGRGEDVAADRRGQHARADEAGVRRLVAGAAAGDERDRRPVPVGAHHDADVRVAVEAREPAAGGRDRPSIASVTMSSRRLMNWVMMSLSGQARCAGGVEVEGVVRAGSAAVSPGRSAVCGVGRR